MSRRRTTVLSDLTVNIKGQVIIVNFIWAAFKFLSKKWCFFLSEENSKWLFEKLSEFEVSKNRKKAIAKN